MAKKVETTPVEPVEEKNEAVETTETVAEPVAEPSAESETVAAEPAKEEALSEEKAEKATKAMDSAFKKAVRRQKRVGLGENNTMLAVTEKQVNDTILQDLMNSMKVGKILTGTLIGVEEFADRVFAFILYKNAYSIYIPVEHFTNIRPNDKRDPHDEAVFQLEHRLHSDVDFIVQSVDSHKKMAVATRLGAMMKKRRRYFFDSVRNARLMIKEGDIVDARVIWPARNSVGFEIFGVETQIFNYELAWEHISDATEYFHNGDIKAVKILEIIKDDLKKTVNIRASVKQATTNPNVQGVNILKEGCKYAGVVSYIDKKTANVFALINGITVMCKLTAYGRDPVPGSKVSIRITKKDVENSHLFGVITHVGSTV